MTRRAVVIVAASAASERPARAETRGREDRRAPSAVRALGRAPISLAVTAAVAYAVPPSPR